MDDCGIDLAGFGGPRRSLGADHTRYERFRQEQVLRFDGAYRLKAKEHSTGRNRAVADLLCYLSLLTTTGTINPGDPIEKVRAEEQSLKASMAGQVSAHVLPCRLLINGKLPFDMTPPSAINAQKVNQALKEDVFGKCTVLPKVFNIADSRAENNCLRGALAAAAQSVIAGTKAQSSEAGVLRRGTGLEHGTIELSRSDLPKEAQSYGIDPQAVLAAYDVWVKAAGAAFGRTISIVQLRGSTMDGDDVSEDVIYILRRYQDSLSEQPAVLDERQIHKLMEGLWA